MFKNIAEFNRVSDYLPILNSVLITDMLVILLLNVGIIKSNVLKQWYKKYNLSAVIADVLIIVIGIIVTRFLYSYIFAGAFSIWKFIFLAVIIQMIHDISFYYFFKNVPKGMNMMLDTFKSYADEVKYKAILADSGMVILACLIASYSANYSLNKNLIILIASVYILPYLIYN